MTLLKKIDYIIKNTDYDIRYNSQEITEVDLDEYTFYYMHGESDHIDGLTEDDFEVYSYKKINDFPKDIFKLSKVFKNILKRIGTSKENIFIIHDTEALFTKTAVRNLAQLDSLLEEIDNFDFYTIKIKKDFLKKNKNFK